MRKRLFYVEWVRRAFGHSISKGDFFSSVSGSALTVASHFLSAMTAHSLANLAWQVPLYGLAAAIALRFLCAPYEMWAEQKAKADTIPPEERPFDISMWDDATEFRLYQAACLWVERSPPASSIDPIPNEAVFALHKIKQGLKAVADERFKTERHGWVMQFVILGLGAPYKEIDNAFVVDRDALADCAEHLGETPRFLFEGGDG